MTTSSPAPRQHGDNTAAHRPAAAGHAEQHRTEHTDHVGSNAPSSRATLEDRHHDHTGREAMIGVDSSRRSSNVSWGAIFAGVATFLALTILFGIAAGAMGLSSFSGTAIGIWSVIFLVIALAAAGYVAGALAVRGGFLHGFLTWATSLLAIVLVSGWIGSSVLGALGNTVGSVANTVSSQVEVTEQDAAAAANEVDQQVSEQDVQDAQDQASETAAQVADASETGMWWTFAGALIGGILAALAGAAGARSVMTRRDESDKRVVTERR